MSTLGVPADLSTVGGLRPLVEIINRADRGTEKLILEGLAEIDPALAEKVRAQMFMFEDIIGLEDRAVQLVLRQVQASDLATALKGVTEPVRAKVMTNMSERAALNLAEEVEMLGPVRVQRRRGGPGRDRRSDPPAGGVRPDRHQQGGRRCLRRLRRCWPRPAPTRPRRCPLRGPQRLAARLTQRLPPPRFRYRLTQRLRGRVRPPRFAKRSRGRVRPPRRAPRPPPLPSRWRSGPPSRPRPPPRRRSPRRGSRSSSVPGPHRRRQPSGRPPCSRSPRPSRSPRRCSTGPASGPRRPGTPPAGRTASRPPAGRSRPRPAPPASAAPRERRLDRERAERALAAVTRAAEGLEQRCAPVLDEIESLLLRSAFELAEAIVGAALRDDELRGEAALRRVLSLVPRDEPLTLRLHPFDHDTLRDREVADRPGVSLVADETLALGDAVAESGVTVVDARISAALDRVRRYLGAEDTP